VSDDGKENRARLERQTSYLNPVETDMQMERSKKNGLGGYLRHVLFLLAEVCLEIRFGLVP
jgi:hypothetical protein